MASLTTQLQVEIIKALAHPARLEIAQALSKGERCVSDLVELVGSDMSTVSKHLRLMREAGWIDCEKKGQQVFYHLGCDCLPTFLDCIAAIGQGGTCSDC
ncbi:MAG: metalloregulator ArsR/SmtB family transcription factor [Verrucomicrobiota bacterium JB023]|nr:metalloregulator ArsR/SmtB family transcription factor [Verrucomicrobiota bacterium JB023]